MKIAFIGLGNMGGGMAANLVKAGYSVSAYDLSETALAKAAENAAKLSIPFARQLPMPTRCHDAAKRQNR